MSDEASPPEGGHHLCGDCRKCGKKPVMTEIVIHQGEKIEKQLCAECAAAMGSGTKAAHAPINQLVQNYVMTASGASQRKATAQGRSCEHCGLTFAEFRKSGLLGCPSCYQAFEKQLSPLLERAHAGGSHHVGKVPRRAGSSTDRQARIAMLRKQLDEAISSEEYERAAAVRDALQNFEKSDASDPHADR